MQKKLHNEDEVTVKETGVCLCLKMVKGHHTDIATKKFKSKNKKKRGNEVLWYERGNKK